MAGERDEHGPLTVIATFTLKDSDDQKFEEVIAEQTEFLSAQRGFRRSVLGRSLRQPNQYVLVSQWEDTRAYLTVARSVQFANYVLGPLSELAEGDSTRAFSVAEREVGDEGIAAVLALTTFTLKEDADAEAFQSAFDQHAEFMRGRAGFLTHRFVRSTSEPGAYRNLGWWRDAEAYLAVMQTTEFQADARKMADLANVEGDLFRIVATRDA